jgi:hypothetical protein
MRLPTGGGLLLGEPQAGGRSRRPSHEVGIHTAGRSCRGMTVPGLGRRDADAMAEADRATIETLDAQIHFFAPSTRRCPTSVAARPRRSLRR